MAQLEFASILVLSFIYLSIPAPGCVCGVPSTPCEAYAGHHGSPTFVGVPISQETASVVADWDKAGTKVQVQKFVFQVQEAFDDVSGRLVAVYGRGTTCDYRFKLGTSYLVYGWRGKDGRVSVDRCTRTAPSTDATEDIKFLHSLPTRKGGQIFGDVYFVNPPKQTGTLSGLVTAIGRDGKHTAQVSVSGRYELNGLQTGYYRLTFSPDHDNTEEVDYNVNVPVAGGCTGVGVRLGNTTVRGSVRDGSGTPVPGAKVFLFYALDGNYHPDVALTTYADALGTFTFHHVEQAKFVLSAQPENSKMIFFPGTQDASKAQVVEVPEDRSLAGLTIILPR